MATIWQIWISESGSPWHDVLDRLYVAVVMSDDEYLNRHDYDLGGNEAWMGYSDSIALAIDGDHSGGEGFRVCLRQCEEEELLRIDGEIQTYKAIARTPSGPSVDMFWTREATGAFLWAVKPPYSDGGGGVAGESPTISVIEMYVTSYDNMIWNNVEESTTTDLMPGNVVGFDIAVWDWDDLAQGANTWTPRFIPERSRDEGISAIWQRKGDRYFDGVLLQASEPEEDSAITVDSWGRIKASLVE